MNTRSPSGGSSAGGLERPSGRELARPVVVVGTLLAVMWVEEIIDLLPGTPFDSWGIRPRTLRGLLGIELAPFLHSGFAHLIANTIPFAVLGVAIAFGSIARFVQVVVMVALTSGIGTWTLGQSNSVHIGASGIVFGLLTYLASRGIFARRILWLIGGVIVMFVYGGILWGLLPRPGVSWTGHVFGAVGGVLAAWILHAERDEAPTIA
ncbi:MAG: rhomboid family intramembrane serine protease [Ilumatobacteraceae bacterium]